VNGTTTVGQYVSSAGQGTFSQFRVFMGPHPSKVSVYKHFKFEVMVGV